MAANKDDDIWLLPAAFVLLFVVVVIVIWVGDDELDTSSKSHTEPASYKVVRTVDANGIQFKIDAHDTNLNIKGGDDALAGLIALIRLRGYRCDTINAARPFLFSGSGYVLDCDGFRYRYTIEDRGGRWTVTVD